jgi:hypothetical protein
MCRSDGTLNYVFIILALRNEFRATKPTEPTALFENNLKWQSSINSKLIRKEEMSGGKTLNI